MEAAWKGDLSAAFDDLNDVEDAAERATQLPFLEVYNPIYSIYSNDVIAVAEFYQVATELEQDLLRARRNSWIVVASVFLGTFALLFGIVGRGSQLIEQQSKALKQRYDMLAKVSGQNEALRRRIQAASARGSELNERFLKRISAELHDGPAQALAYASLRLESLAEPGLLNVEDSEAAAIKRSLDAALVEIKGICRGLSLPEIELKPIDDVIRAATQAHRQRTHTTVDLVIKGYPDTSFDHAAKICAYRFIQECLSNAYRHAEGKGQKVEAAFSAGQLSVTVSDTGKGFEVDAIVRSDCLGLRGLRDRIESHGGVFSLTSAPDGGTKLEMVINAREPTSI